MLKPVDETSLLNSPSLIDYAKTMAQSTQSMNPSGVFHLSSSCAGIHHDHNVPASENAGDCQVVANRDHQSTEVTVDGSWPPLPFNASDFALKSPSSASDAQDNKLQFLPSAGLTFKFEFSPVDFDLTEGRQHAADVPTPSRMAQVAESEVFATGPKYPGVSGIDVDAENEVMLGDWMGERRNITDISSEIGESHFYNIKTKSRNLSTAAGTAPFSRCSNTAGTMVPVSSANLPIWHAREQLKEEIQVALKRLEKVEHMRMKQQKLVDRMTDDILCAQDTVAELLSARDMPGRN